jgi:hypothetical protein
LEPAAVNRYRYKITSLDPNTHEVKTVLHGSGDTLKKLEMQYHDIYLLQKAQERLREQFGPLPERSPQTSISASYAAWNRHGPSIIKAFKRIGALAGKVRQTEYEWVRNVTKELEVELGEIRAKLTECALGSPPEEDA